MLVKVNGKEEVLKKEMTISGLLAQKKLSPDKLIIELNFKIILKEDLDKIILKENDQLEILSFVTGG